VTRIAFYDFLESRQKSKSRRDSLQLSELDTTVTFQTPFSNMMSNQYLDSLFRTKTEIFTNLSFGTNEIRSVPESEFIFLDRTKIVPYRWQFSIFESSFDVSNEVLFDGLDSYAAEGGTYQRPPTGLL